MLRTSDFAQKPTSLDETRSAPKGLVLVIDPDESSRSVLEVALARDGFEVWTASNGLAGMTLLQGRVPSVIVLESDVGSEDGITFVAQLRGDDRLMNVPVLLLSGESEADVEALADAVGVDDFLQKPAYARDVAAMVKVELARASQARGPLHFEAEDLLPEQLLRALLTCSRSGRLISSHGGEIRFRAGKVIDARIAGRGGTVETVVRILALTTHGYQLVLEPVDGFAEMRCGLREVVELVLPRLQRWTRVLQRSLPLESKLTVDFRKLARSFESMPDGVNRVVQLFDGHRTVEHVLLESTLDETLTIEVATRLYLMGVLQAAQGNDDELFVLRPMPRLFEPAPNEAQELMQHLFAGTANVEMQELVSPYPEGDWSDEGAHETGLDVDDASGGWLSAPVPAALAEGLPPALAAQLAAFPTPVHVEPATPAPAMVEVKDFAAQTETSASDSTLEQAILGATSGDASVSDIEAQLNGVLAESPEELEGPTPAPVHELQAVANTAENTFFGDESSSELIEGRRSTRVWPFIAAAVGIAALAAIIEVANSKATVEVEPPAAVAIVAAPPELPVVEEPVFIPVEEEVAAAPVVDVSESLIEAKKFYEAGQYKKAISTLEQVLSDDPTSVTAWNLLGLSRYDSNDTRGAKEAAEKVLELDPKNGRVQILLATLAFDANQKEEGRAALNKYLELEPNGPHADEARALLRH